jgi:hypothetical protein
MSSCIGTIRLPVESMVDAIAFLIQAMFYAITAIVESIFDAIARVCKSCPANDQQRSACCNCFPGIHIKSPLYPYKVVLSVRTTALPEIG